MYEEHHILSGANGILQVQIEVYQTLQLKVVLHKLYMHGHRRPAKIGSIYTYMDNT